MESPTTARPQWRLESTKRQNLIVLSGDWTTQEGHLPHFPPDSLKPAHSNQPLTFRTDDVGRWNTGLIRFLWEVKQAAIQARLDLQVDSLPPPARKLLELLPDRPAEQASPPPASFTPLADIGRRILDSLTEIGIVSELSASVVVGGVTAVFGRSRMRAVDLFTNIRDAGPSSLPIVSVVNFLIGAILAFVGAVQLKKFAADIYVANLVDIAMVREMAAVMTAVIMSGRTGGAYAARIATMMGNEEIDALTVSGIPESSYLILPSVLALMTTMPLLYLYACLVSMAGGCAVSMAMLAVTPAGYLNQTLDAVQLDQFAFGFVKSIVFAGFIGLTSCRIGLKAGRSAADVGIAATRAVVVGIVGVIAIDAAFAIIANAFGL